MAFQRALTRPQMTIYNAGWDNNSRFRVAVCGRRFGKTYLAAEEIRRAVRIAITRGIPPENEIWYGAPTYKQAKRIFWPRLKRFIPAQWLLTSPNESELTIRCKPYGHTVRIVGLDNYDTLRGTGLFFFLGDEWADVADAVWPEILRPMLATTQGHALFLGTPKGYGNFYDFYMKGQPGETKHAGWWSCLYTTMDGGNVPAHEINGARDTLDSRQYRQEYEASFENFSGRCLYSFSRSESVKKVAYDPNSTLHIGLDFNINPMSATVWQENLDAGGQIITCQVDELVLSTSNTSEMGNEIRRRYGRFENDFSSSSRVALSHITIYPDPAGQARRTSSGGHTDISILRDFGFQIFIMNRAPPVRDRLNFTNAMFQNSLGIRKAFVSSHCSKSIESYERYSYKSGSSEPEKTGGFDHLVDATGYYFVARFGHDKFSTIKTSILNR
ncbi:hypothetical protein [Acetobacter sp. DsW_063]|uniref:hypothetical protein n=1 Tax=Acetobacter sp. DsW_063 TaxID=1514894 RepID=UPI000A3CBAD8|nr:hypothetical protein [Acetobacter sp. DsW_063]OUJ16043.1 hypothetical protein HK28_05405 [Acetobacter sp. DsW_063]